CNCFLPPFGLTICLKRSVFSSTIARIETRHFREHTMNRFTICFACLIVLSAWSRSEPNHADTRLLSQPAVSASHVAFIYADDLFVCDLDGHNVRRLTSDQGIESHPVFSPDGQTIAFSAQYDGNTDVYTIPVSGGSPTRLTTHPGADVVRG